MTIPDRRKMLHASLAIVALPSMALHLGCTSSDDAEPQKKDGSPNGPNVKNTETNNSAAKGNPMQVQYLEIVTPDVDAVCNSYAQMHGVTFSGADPSLGGARTAELLGGGMLGVRAPMRDTEKPVVRPYLLVADIKASVDAAEKAGAEIAMPPMEIPGKGSFAIVIQVGIESGLWQL